MKHFRSIAPKVVPIGAVPIEKVRIVVDAASHVTERFRESLPIGHRVWRIAKVPLSDVPGNVTVFRKHFANCRRRRWHAADSGA